MCKNFFTSPDKRAAADRRTRSRQWELFYCSIIFSDVIIETLLK